MTDAERLFSAVTRHSSSIQGELCRIRTKRTLLHKRNRPVVSPHVLGVGSRAYLSRRPGERLSVCSFISTRLEKFLLLVYSRCCPPHTILTCDCIGSDPIVHVHPNVAVDNLGVMHYPPLYISQYHSNPYRVPTGLLGLGDGTRVSAANWSVEAIGTRGCKIPWST